MISLYQLLGKRKQANKIRSGHETHRPSRPTSSAPGQDSTSVNGTKQTNTIGSFLLFRLKT